MTRFFDRFQEAIMAGRMIRLCAPMILACALFVNAQNNYLGEIKMFAGNFAPTGWALCDGQLLPIAQNQALFALLGTTYGGDGITTFALPDLRGRVPIHAGTGTGLSARQLGEMGGQESVVLTTQQLPSHTHTATIAADSTVSTTDSPQRALPARNAASTPSYGTSANSTLASTAVAVGSTGGGQAHPNMQPYTCVYFIIALQGIFPSRN